MLQPADPSGDDSKAEYLLTSQELGALLWHQVVINVKVAMVSASEVAIFYPSLTISFDNHMNSS
ncbi:hypothetical protein J6590_043122 [Homalodisca vitripennis]|nr:hypothetical protein J6590_104303 [Homalodisca vitripennis]KAG8331356.1 hypothetical protein J6590_043122 [Homalodisca vitripennis]